MTDCNFSHDSKLVVSCSDLDRSIKLWDASSGKMIKEIVGKENIGETCLTIMKPYLPKRTIA